MNFLCINLVNLVSDAQTAVLSHQLIHAFEIIARELDCTSDTLSSAHVTHCVIIEKYVVALNTDHK